MEISENQTNTNETCTLPTSVGDSRGTTDTKKYFFKHLNTIDQNYGGHWCDAMKYCGMCLKAGFFFFIHAFLPDCFVKNGSTTIFKLNDIIMEKLNNARPPV